jgi:hypothetical protein
MLSLDSGRIPSHFPVQQAPDFIPRKKYGLFLADSINFLPEAPQRVFLHNGINFLLRFIPGLIKPGPYLIRGESGGGGYS